MDNFEESLNKLLVETFDDILKYEEQSLQKISSIPITLAEAHLLLAVAQNGGAAIVSELSDILKVTRPTVTVAVKKLEDKGFLQKEISTEDARKTIITLTAQGQKAQRAHDIFHKKMVRNISSQFNEEEKRVLLVTMGKLSKYFKDKVKR